jgi:DNA polymerase-1
VTDTRTLILVDGSSYLYRAFHALPPLSNSRGEPTGAVLGVLNMLLKLIKETPHGLLAVVFDASGRTFRDDLFAEYKANRTPMPDDLRSQVAPLIEAVEALGLPLLRVDGVEADDVIGTLACQASADGIRVIISTGDKDMAQLVDERISLVNTMSDTSLDRAGVKAKFDVYPEQIIDYLALVGDSSDNIPGVPKVGPKTAAKWLNEYQTLDALLANQDRIEGKVGENLRAHSADVALSRALATINTKLELAVRPPDLVPRERDVARLRALYTRLELRSLLRQLPGGDAVAMGGGRVEVDRTGAATAATVTDAGATDAPADAAPFPPPVERHYETVFDTDRLDEWLRELERADAFAITIETTPHDQMQAGLVGVSIAIEPGRVAYIPLAHDYPGAPAQLDRAQVLARLRPLLEDDARDKVGHHLKIAGHVLRNHGVELRGMRFDSMLESYVLNSTATRHDLDTTARLYLGVEAIAYDSVAGRGAKRLAFNEVPLEQGAAYAAEHADLALQLHRTLWPRLAAIPSLRQLYDDLEQPLAQVLLDMEHAGVLIDADMLRRQSGTLAQGMLDLQNEAHRAAGVSFNLDSPKQLQDVLFGKLGLPVQRRTPSGQPSTAEDVLEELAAQYDLPRIIMNYRALTKLKSTYTDKLPNQVNPRTGRVHTCYHQAVAATGRLSSTEPNLQNIPIRTPEGRRIRQAFVAPPGFVMMAADYSQIELRIMAHLSGDESLLRAFAEDLDIHLATAAEVFGADPARVAPDQRRAAKAINFGLIYGMSAFGLARQLGIDRGAAQKYIDLYFQRYPGVKYYMDSTRAAARERGYVETVFGRRLYLPDIRTRNAQLRQYAERSAINAPMQGTAADIIKRAMLAVHAWLGSESHGARLVMQVHDELVLEVPVAAADAVESGLRARMSAAADLRVPLKVEVGRGGNWDEAH